jgi:predicted amidohydrolase
MATWKTAVVQMDCRLGDTGGNGETIRTRLAEAADHGARLVVFPECAVSGYAFASKEEARRFAEPVPGHACHMVAEICRARKVWAVFGLVEVDPATDNLYNACALVGPEGFVACYRKIHLPCLGVDKFVAGGDRPFAVQDLGGLRIGMMICYDGGFPESARVLTLLGADLLVLPTNWPTGARNTIRYLVQARAMENHVYFAAANRVGEERGFRFRGESRFVDCDGELMAWCNGDREEILYATIDPENARQKREVKIPGEYEIDRVNDRRPDMYGLICKGP